MEVYNRQGCSAPRHKVASIVKSHIENLKSAISQLEELYATGDIKNLDKFTFDQLLITIIEEGLNLKVQQDMPEAPFNPRLHDHLTLTTETFAYSQGKIILKKLSENTSGK